MNARPLRSYEDGDDMDDSDQRDRTLRALEGRSENDYRQITPPDSAEAAPDGESTADIFMRIAREDSTRRGADESGGEGSAITRVARSLHRRPLSAAVPSYHTTSPPQVTRRLSDQRETSRTRRLADEQPAQSMTRELAYRAISKEKPTLNLDDIRSRTAASVGRPSPITPRSQTFQDAGAEGGYPYSRRRPSLTESSPGTLPSRTSTFKHTYGLPKTYNSSPLVPKHADPHHVSEASHGPEGTESTSSTAAPSTVWDELDDLKSRIHRLELTGKLPPTSGSAMSRASDDRPPTATTNATTMSASPKRGSGNSVAQAEASSTTSSQRETQPILLSALSKSKPFISPDVYEAIESAATDALALSQLMGTVGQPGPISSGASTIGVGGPATVTDRQLRRKADSICRSLTGLCLALSEEASQKKPTQTVATPSKEKETVASPTVSKTVAGVAAQRRGSAVIDQATIKIDPVTSPPRAPTRLEERRANLLNSSALPSPRYALAPGTTTDQVAGPGRKSSLLISRTRRAGTEEPEDSGRKSSLLLRTRRAGTEEPEEGRKTSLLLRQRRGTNDDEEDTRIRAPSRAVTEIAGLRAAQREYPTHVPHVPAEPAPLASSALPRRRLVPSSLNSRLVAPSPPTSMSTRRYLDRATPERDTIAVADKLAEDRPQRQLSLGQAAMLNRTGSLSRRRDSAIPLSASASQVGSYR
ncbi:LPxTG-motif cell wall anchor domain-containing protein [Pleurostoma richardsiae]|uniref:LPxTG-motif cell wall anchor domain-containing protein n=1 Tax=Pleurostoma richardsiae TaxID=41990 RepID=A0AA38VEQ4_9PEZI|nr:LPxTG-motif cell wall anchor domain-containing protein [Pleurostoma richardsiae]